jgi:hypothetical protein
MTKKLEDTENTVKAWNDERIVGYGITIDPSCKDIARPTFVSWDPDLFVNSHPQYFNSKKWIRPLEDSIYYEPPVDLNNGWKEKYGSKVIESCCDEIRRSQPGEQHHIRLKKARLIGGYIAGGYINEDVALSEFEKASRDSGATNIRAAMKTITDGIQYGKGAPIIVEQKSSPPASHTAPTVKSESVVGPLGNASISNIATLLNRKIEKNRSGGKIGEDTGFRFMQRSIHGFVKTFLYVIGAYTSVGKTALMVQMVVNAVMKNPGIRMAVFSTEMAGIHILLRLLANRTAVPSLSIFKGQLGPEDDQLVQRAYKHFSDKNLWLFDNLYTVEAIESACTELGNLDVIFIDFLQNLHGDGSIYERMSTVPLRLQEMAKTLNTCVVGMSQVNNESVKSSSPVIGFKGAGEIAAACDLGLWLVRDLSEKEILKCYIRKNRHGPTGKVTLKYVNNFTGIKEVTI